MVTIKDLKYLRAIHEHRHFGKAATACFVSQPTLSGQIKKLEEQLGLVLIERNRHHLMLTDAGQALIHKAQAVLQAAEDFEQTAKTLTDPFAGELHVGLIPTLAPYLLPHIMPPLAQALPDTQILLFEEPTEVLLSQLQEGQLDVLILPWLESMSKLNRIDVFDEPLVLTTPRDHELAQQESITLDQLRGQHVLVLKDDHCLRNQSLDYCFSAGAREDTRFQATSLETLRYMVAGGLGVTLMPKLAVNTLSITENLCYRPFADPVPIRTVSAVTRPQFPRQKLIEKVADTIRAASEEFLASPIPECKS